MPQVDDLMQEARVDALVVLGGTQDNPHMRYLLPRGRVSHAVLVKLRGRSPEVWVSAMEREEAAQSPVTVRTWSEARWEAFLRETGGNRTQAWVRTLAYVLAQYGLEQGRVAFVGKVELGTHWTLLQELQQRLPGMTILGQEGHNVLLAARSVKRPDEVERIARMGQVTVEVVGKLWDWLASRRLEKGVLMDGDQPVTIGRVKRLVRRWLLERGAVTPLGIIFAQGRDAGIPHSMGREEEPLYAGRPIVFDLFPQEEGGGYFFDFTRTWSLGYATDEALTLYEQVLEAHHRALKQVRAGVPGEEPYLQVCAYFEERGHPTLRSHPGTQEGFVHTLGHGLGLDIHEMPGLRSGMKQPLPADAVVTVEPGLYYPERGMGFRVEDVVHLPAQGPARVLAGFPYDFVLPVRGSAG